ncbi:MAG: pyruvate kinase [Acidimicrobiia bacterium]|nr:pyruvate kinase [Acidimicrobiia bacterium]MBT8216015.1 pyruvate kinase [Acidimicrobiia bacterium]NNF10742.1 pyruvate kinase [Acidimicrobiia bacterium]NNL69229.1 pyruvate kinase [Acidimicrobiia bacterium]
MRRKTKIIATLGPAVADAYSISRLVEAGMDVARLNFSHGSRADHEQNLAWVHEASEKHGRAIAVLQDIQGPKIRVGTFPDGSISLEPGDSVELLPGEEEAASGEIYIKYLDRVENLASGDLIQLQDGRISVEIASTSTGIKATVIQGGELRNKQGAAFPGLSVDLPAITEKDRADLEAGAEMGVDAVAASFVGTAGDVEEVRKLAGDVPVIAKLERAIGYRSLDEIIRAADGVMVARGDLGVELSWAALPRVQKDIIARTNAGGKISITATEMLESMKESFRPTRAEVTDVANAVFDGTDAVMLSAETAVGKYPIRSVEVMKFICQEAEKSPELHLLTEDRFIAHAARFPSAIAKAAVEVSHNLGIPNLACFTETGSTARLLSKYRPEADIMAFTNHETTFRRMAAYWGVQPRLIGRHDTTDDLIIAAGDALIAEGIVEPGEHVVMVAGIPPNQGAQTNLVQIHRVGSGLKRNK